MLCRIDENVEIDTAYITCAEYQLFINQRQKLGQNQQPDHWQSAKFLPGNAKSPITGVRASDAVAFCEWLTQKHPGSGVKYRLPTLEEAQLYPLQNNENIGYWCSTKLGYAIVGVVPENEQIWKRNLFHHCRDTLSLVNKFFFVEEYVRLQTVLLEYISEKVPIIDALSFSEDMEILDFEESAAKANSINFHIKNRMKISFSEHKTDKQEINLLRNREQSSHSTVPITKATQLERTIDSYQNSITVDAPPKTFHAVNSRINSLEKREHVDTSIISSIRSINRRKRSKTSAKEFFKINVNFLRYRKSSTDYKNSHIEEDKFIPHSYDSGISKKTETRPSKKAKISRIDLMNEFLDHLRFNFYSINSSEYIEEKLRRIIKNTSCEEESQKDIEFSLEEENTENLLDVYENRLNASDSPHDPEIVQISTSQVSTLVDTLIPIDVCRRYRIVPISKYEGDLPYVIVAMVDPDNLDAIDSLNQVLYPESLGLQRMVITTEDYQRVISKYLDEQIEKQKKQEEKVKRDPYILVVSIIWNLLSNFFAELYKHQNSLLSFGLTTEALENLSSFCANKSTNSLKFYLFLGLTDERKAGQIPAWEGIRIVREKIR